jgi:hypothetical protein
MQRRSLFSRLGNEGCLTALRTMLAASLALAIALTPHLFLRGLVGSFGMYAVTDGVFAALSRPRSAERSARFEGALSLVLGSAIMLGSDSQQSLLTLFCVRNVLVAGGDLLLAWRTGGRGWLKPRAPAAWLAYAALGLGALAISFLFARAGGEGALDLSAYLAGQLALWAALMGAHTLRITRRPASADEAYAIGPRRTWG